MVATKKDYPYELIGQEITVVSSKNPSDLKVKGKIVDETKNTLKVSQSGKIKSLMKNNIVFKLKDRIIEGKIINKRTEERIK